jgi:hypothetical protein
VIAPPEQVWIVHSANGITAIAYPIDPINSGAGSDAPEPAPDPQKEIHS